MNGETTGTVFGDSLYPSYVNIKYVIADRLKNKFFGIDEGYYINMDKRNDLGLKSISHFDSLVQVKAISNYIIKDDTLVGLRNFWIERDADEFDNTYFDRINEINLMQNELYESVALNKLGWINIDRFYPDIIERNVITINIDEEFPILRIYVIERSTNTLVDLTLPNSIKDGIEVSLPANHKFEIIALAGKKGEFYSFKKIMRLTKDRLVNINLKKVDADELGQYLL